MELWKVGRYCCSRVCRGGSSRGGNNSNARKERFVLDGSEAVLSRHQ